MGGEVHRRSSLWEVKSIGDLVYRRCSLLEVQSMGDCAHCNANIH